jgi:hypothetical protein
LYSALCENADQMVGVGVAVDDEVDDGGQGRNNRAMAGSDGWFRSDLSAAAESV